MRVNVYAEEVTDNIEVVTKVVNNQEFIGVRFYLELPAQLGQARVKGPFHMGEENESSAVTFWAGRNLRATFVRALDAIDTYQGLNKSREF